MAKKEEINVDQYIKDFKEIVRRCLEADNEGPPSLSEDDIKILYIFSISFKIFKDPKAEYNLLVCIIEFYTGDPLNEIYLKACDRYLEIKKGS